MLVITHPTVSPVFIIDDHVFAPHVSAGRHSDLHSAGICQRFSGPQGSDSKQNLRNPLSATNKKHIGIGIVARHVYQIF